MTPSEDSLVHPDVQRVWNATLEKGGADKQYPSLDLVRLEKWHFGGRGKGHVLEYACGTGLNLIHLLKCGYTVDAIDAAPAAIAIVKRKLDALPELRCRASLHVLEPSATRLPFEDAAYDFVNCMNVLSLLSAPARITALFQELRRVMKPGAKIILDINGPKADFAVKGTAVGGDVYMYGQPPVPTYCPRTAEQFEAMIAPWFSVDDVGFTHHRYFQSEIQEFIVCGHKG